MSVRRIVPDLACDTPAESAAFYRELLGLELVMDLGWVVTLAHPGRPELQLTLLAPNPEQPPHPAVSIEVDDVNAAHAAAQAHGAEIVYPLTDEPWGVRRFFVRDPAGHVVNILAHTTT